jgi:Trk-type K+ transport system membrane component
MNLVSKAFLVVNMIAGRFEIIAIVYLFIEMLKRKK